MSKHPGPTPNATFSIPLKLNRLRKPRGEYQLEYSYLRYNRVMIIPNQNVDTRSEADVVLTQLIQNQDPSKRLAGAVAASNRVAQQCKDAILRMNPELSSTSLGNPLSDTPQVPCLQTSNP